MAAFGLEPSAVDQLVALLEALAAEPHPPTTVRAPPEALARHVADSLAGLAVSRLKGAARIADIGAGVGFPGLALAVALPAATVDLIEATRKKCALIDRLGAAAGLANARAVPERAEEWAVGQGRERYDVVTARALAPLAVLAEYSAPLLVQGGALVAWKGARDPEEEAAGERAAAALGLAVEPAFPVQPFPAARGRHLHVFSKVAPTPERFPRRAGVARKRPLGSDPRK